MWSRECELFLLPLVPGVSEVIHFRQSLPEPQPPSAFFGDEMTSPISGRLRIVPVFYVWVFNGAHVDNTSYGADLGAINHDLFASTEQ